VPVAASRRAGSRSATILDALIIGAGPSGLTAADRLAAGGIRPLVVERSKQVGGLMRSVRHGPFTVDLGRKELYSRIPEVDALWSEVLGEDYHPYAHRVGSLFDGRILELSGRYRGPLRGMPAGMVLRGGAGLARGWLDGALHRPDTYERFWHQRVGATFAGLLAQGYWEKFRGQRWRDQPAPAELGDGERLASHSFGAITHALRVARRGGLAAQKTWRHPARGAGQLTEALAERVRKAGVEIRFGTEVTRCFPRSDGLNEITLMRDGETVRCLARHVVSSLAPEALDDLLSCRGTVAAPAGTRAVALVYLFLKVPTRFPHAWLEVNDARLRVGRITNYAAFGRDMVPAGMGALCAEYFLDGDDPLLSQGDRHLARLATGELERARLLDRCDIADTLVVRLERCNAAASWREAQDRRRAEIYDRLRDYPSLFHVNRPGTDWASFAGLCAAQAVLTGDRRTFDLARAALARLEAELPT